MAKKKRKSKRKLLKRRTQTGTSNRRSDRRYLALPPGTRVSSTGRLYVERRANRSDRSRKKRL